MNQQRGRNQLTKRAILVIGVALALGAGVGIAVWLRAIYPRLQLRAAARETDAGRPMGAVRILWAVLNREPRLAEAYRELGRAYSLLGHRRAAIEALKIAVEQEPENATLWYALGVSFFLSGDSAGTAWALGNLAACPGGAPLADALAARVALQEVERAARSALLQLCESAYTDSSFEAARHLARLQFEEARQTLSSPIDERMAAQFERGAEELERAMLYLRRAAHTDVDGEISELLAALCMDSGYFEEAAEHCAALPTENRFAVLCGAMLRLRVGTLRSDRAFLDRLRDAAHQSVEARALLVEDALAAEEEIVALNEAKLATAESLWQGRPRYLEGRQAIVAEQPKAALSSLKAAAADYPHWVAPLYWWAITDSATDRVAAIRGLGTVLSNRPHLARARIALARLSLEEGDALLESPLLRDPRVSASERAAFARRAYQYQKDAAEHSRLAMVADPLDRTAGRLLALSLVELHDYCSAERQYYRLILDAAGKPAQDESAGTPYVEGLDTERVLLEFVSPLSSFSRRVADLDRSFLEAFTSLTAGRPGKAAETLAATLDAHPTVPFARLQLARAYALGGDLEKATDSFRYGADLARSMGTSLGLFLVGLARVQWAQENLPEALVQYRLAVQERDCPKEAYYELAKLMLSLDPKLESAVERVALLDPLTRLAEFTAPGYDREEIQRAVVRDMRGAVLSIADQALTEAQLALADNAGLRCTRAQLSFRRGLVEPASEQFERALRLQPGFAPAYEGIVLRLVRARFQLGDLLRIISLSPDEAAPLLRKWRQVESGLRKYLDDTLRIISQSQDLRPDSADLALCRALAHQMIQLVNYSKTGVIDMGSVLSFSAEAAGIDDVSTSAATAFVNLLHVSGRADESVQVLQFHRAFSALSRVMVQDFLNHFWDTYRAVGPGQQRTLPFGVSNDLPLVLLAMRYSLHDAAARLLDSELAPLKADDALVNYVLATHDLLAGRLPQAEARYAMLAERYPDLADVQVLLARVALKDRRPEDAIKAYRAALSLDSRHRSALLELAVVLLQQNRPREALACLEGALELARQEPNEPLYRDADWLTAPSTDSIEEIRPLVRQARISTAAGYWQGRALRMLMILEDKTSVPPVETWRIVLRTLDRVSLQMWIAAEHEKVGETERALSHYRTALADNPSSAYRRIIMEAVDRLQKSR